MHFQVKEMVECEMQATWKRKHSSKNLISFIKYKKMIFFIAEGDSISICQSLTKKELLFFLIF